MIVTQPHKRAYYLVNGISLYRLLAAPVLLILMFTGYIELFTWLLLVSFSTDAIDGFLARRYQVVSIMGARLDSAADDLTMLVSIIAIFYLKPEFIRSELPLIIVLLALYLLQMALALYRYRRLTSFHTYLAKIAALAQGVFILLLFFMEETPLAVFYIASLVTIADLLEEIVLVLILKEWRTDVKGLHWVRKERAGT